MMGDFNPNVDPVSSHDTQIQGEISTKNPLLWQFLDPPAVI